MEGLIVGEVGDRDAAWPLLKSYGTELFEAVGLYSRDVYEMADYLVGPGGERLHGHH